MNKQTITAIIPAKNEENNIKRCIESLKWCDKIQVLWMGDDRTGELAKELGAEVVEMTKSTDSDFVAVQKNINWAIKNTETDWILRIDADEVVTPELRNEIERILTERFAIHDIRHMVYGLARKQYFMGQFLRGGDWAYDRLVRLFKKDAAMYDPIVKVHEQFKVTGEIGYLNGALEHYSHPTLNDAIRKFNIYTSMEAKALDISPSLALFKMIFLPPYIFLRWMIWHKGYKDGARGVIAGIMRGWYEFLVYAKYIQKTLRQDL